MNGSVRVKKTKKRIILAANVSWYLYNFRRNTILRLIEEGHEVITVSSHDSFSQKLQELGSTYRNIKMDSGGKNPIKDFKTIIDLCNLYRMLKPDLVLNFTPKMNIYGSFACRLNKVNVINNVSGLGSIFIEENLLSKVVRVLYKLSQQKVNKIFFQNDDDKELLNGFLKLPVSRIGRIPGSGVDLSRFIISEAPDDSVIRFLLVARLLYEKGIGLYAEAAKILKSKYPNLEFRLVGFMDSDNPSAINKDELQEWVDKNYINYLGSTNNIEEKIKDVDCVVLPSYYREGVPKSLLEAAAMGKPIVTSDSVGCREVVNEGSTGFLHETKNLDDLVVMLEKIILLPHKQRLLMGKRGREKVIKEFDEEIVIEKYLKEIDKILPQ
jgi:glycosyltransferase involved in cell wall biosynthesis